MSDTTATYGGDLTSRIANGGTVQLVVDHSEEHYCVEADADYLESDFQEIHDYLLKHGFVIMDEDECPAEALKGGGWRIWVCHRDGEEFGFVRLGQLIAVAAFGSVALFAPVLQALTQVAA